MELALGGGVLAAAVVVGILIRRMRAAHELDSTRLRIQYAVARTLYESRSLEEAAPRLLEAIGSPLGWEIGGLWLVSPPRALHCVASWHAVGVEPEGADKLSRRYVVMPGFGLPGRVWETGEPGWLADVVEDRDFPRAELAAQVGLHGAVAFPIRTAVAVLGVIEFFTREFREPDLAMLELMAAVGSQVGEFIERQRSSDALKASEELQRRIATALQESLLPPELPAIPGLRAAARFRPTGEVGLIGGDFYDLFQAGDGRWAVAVGDVCGKGPDAAAITGLARYTLRAAAMGEPSPSRSLAILNEALLRQRSDLRFCTVAYAYVEPRAGGVDVTLASGGHPPPLVLRRGGAVEWLGRPGTLLGVWPDPKLADTRAELAAGDALVLYTDGVSEARGAGGSLDEAGLAELVRGCAGLDADGIAARIESAALDIQSGTPRDDIAVVVLQVGDTAARTG